MTEDIDSYHPFSGRFVKEDGTTVNIADKLGGKSVSDKVYDIDNMMHHFWYPEMAQFGQSDFMREIALIY